MNGDDRALTLRQPSWLPYFIPRQEKSPAWAGLIGRLLAVEE
jgi:hypothetical protein